MKHPSKNINVNCNKGAEAEEDKNSKEFETQISRILFNLIKWKEKTVGFGLKVH